MFFFFHLNTIVSLVPNIQQHFTTKQTLNQCVKPAQVFRDPTSCCWEQTKNILQTNKQKTFHPKT